LKFNRETNYQDDRKLKYPLKEKVNLPVLNDQLAAFYAQQKILTARKTFSIF